MDANETVRHLRYWMQDQATSERLAAQILAQAGYVGLDPSHPMGGPDGGFDAVGSREGQRWGMAVYFPRDTQSFNAIKAKFTDDASKMAEADAYGIAFVTNQPIKLGQRDRLTKIAKDLSLDAEIFHLERVAHILDTPAMQSVRRQFLPIQDETWLDDAHRAVRDEALQAGEQCEFGARVQAFTWPIAVGADYPAGVTLLRAGERVDEVLPIEVLDPSRLEKAVLIICGPGADPQDALSAVLAMGEGAGWKAQYQGPLEHPATIVAACTYRVADVTSHLRALLDSGLGGTGRPTVAWGTITASGTSVSE